VILSGADALLGPKSLRNPGAVSPPGVVEYLDKLLGIQVTGATVDTAFLRGASETKLSSLTLELIDEKLSRFMPREAAVFGATRTAASILRYGSEYTQLAAMLLPRGPDRGPIALYGFPLEELQSTGDREEFWGRTLSDLGVVVSPAAETKAAVEPVRAAVRKPAARKPVAKPRATPKTSRRR